ncbi:MAG: integrase [Thiothrix nivea]|nr:MAG: integrase [Thiothrix nivea]
MTKKLTNTTVKNARPKPDGKPDKLSDGGGLYLLVNQSGKYWRYDYRYAGKRRTLALGVYPSVSLANARELHEQARQWLSKGVDPKAAKDRKKLEAIRHHENTFQSIAEQWQDYESTHWSESHANSVERILRRDVLPWLGSRPVNEIEPPELLQILRRMEKRVGDTTRKARQVMGQIFRYGVQHGFCQRDPTADLRGAIKRTPVKHYPAITDPAKLGELLRAIDRYGGDYTTTQALKFIPLVMTRPQNIRLMEWSEVDMAAGLWHVPANKIKLKQTLKNANRPEDGQTVPLSRQAVAILEDIQPLTGRFPYVFYSNRSKSGIMSENTLNNAIKRLGFGDLMTSHGFRGTASTLLHEMGYRPEIIEAALFHKEPNQVKAAYNHAQYIEERRKMMQQWADYLDGLRDGAQVIPIQRKQA